MPLITADGEECAAARGERRRELRTNRKLASIRLATLHRLVPDETRVPGIIQGHPE